MERRSPFQQLPMGSFVRSISIQRSAVSNGARGRAVLIDPSPRAIYLAYDNANKCAILADQDAVIKYRLTPRTYYLFLLARLNTDMKGNQVGDEIVVEYLRLSDNIYEGFVDTYTEMDQVNSIILKPVTKKGQNGQDFSYVEPIPSKEAATDAVYDAIEKMDVEALWQLVQIDCGKTVEEYEAILAAKPVTGEEARQIENQASGRANIGRPRQIAQTQQSRPAQPAAQRPSVRPQRPPVEDVEPMSMDEVAGMGEDFAEGDEFAED